MNYIEMRTFGNCILYHGDSMEILPHLGAVDHVMFDPPYEDSMHDSMKKGLLRTDGGNEGDALNFDSITAIRKPVTEHIARLSNGWVILFCTPEGVCRWADAINDQDGIKYKRAGPWIKPDGAPQFNGQGPAAGCEMIVAAWAGTGHSSWNGGGKRFYYTHLVNPPSRCKIRKDGKTVAAHPTEKPISLMKELLADFTNVGQVILDPFMGIGSTGVACVNLGRHFIGIEKNKEYFDLACQRIEAAQGNVDPFLAVAGDKVKQASLFAEK